MGKKSKKSFELDLSKEVIFVRSGVGARKVAPTEKSHFHIFFVIFGVQRVSRPNGEFCLDFTLVFIEKTLCFYSYFAFRERNPFSGPEFF